MPPAFDPRCWFHTLRHRAKTFVGARPRLFFPLFRHRAGHDDLLVTRSTDLCVEGFPRSAFEDALQADASFREALAAAERLFAAYVDASPLSVDDPHS